MRVTSGELLEMLRGGKEKKREVLNLLVALVASKMDGLHCLCK